jgi:hypothetical protein
MSNREKIRKECEQLGLIRVREKLELPGGYTIHEGPIVRAWVKDKETEKSKWHNSYFWDKIFPILLTGLLTGTVSFIVGYCLRITEVRTLKEDVQFFKDRQSEIRFEMKEAIDSRDPSKITALFDKINRQNRR